MVRRATIQLLEARPRPHAGTEAPAGVRDLHDTGRVWQPSATHLQGTGRPPRKCRNPVGAHDILACPASLDVDTCPIRRMSRLHGRDIPRTATPRRRDRPRRSWLLRHSRHALRDSARIGGEPKRARGTGSALLRCGVSCPAYGCRALQARRFPTDRMKAPESPVACAPCPSSCTRIPRSAPFHLPGRCRPAGASGSA